jgi:hypothetical protein
VRTAARGYAEDLWDDQMVRAFVWIEKTGPRRHRRGGVPRLSGAVLCRQRLQLVERDVRRCQRVRVEVGGDCILDGDGNGRVLLLRAFRLSLLTLSRILRKRRFFTVGLAATSARYQWQSGLHADEPRSRFFRLSVG